MRDPSCALALLAACARSGTSFADVVREHSVSGSLRSSDLEQQLSWHLEGAEVFYTRRAVQAWQVHIEALRGAREALPQAVELGLAEAACFEVITEALRRAEAVDTSIAAVPDDLWEPPAGVLTTEFAPDLPLRPARYVLNELRSRDETSDEDRHRAREALRTLTSATALARFSRAVQIVTTEQDLSSDEDLDHTLMDALAIREMAGELYALTGDEALFHEIERVDAVLDTEPYRDAMFAVSRSRWRLVDERVPSPDHWWGVRTWVEENGPASAIRVAIGHREEVVGGVSTSTTHPPGNVIPVTHVLREPSVPYAADPLAEVKQELAKVIPIADARRARNDKWKSLRPEAPASAMAASDPTRSAPNFVWRASEGEWFAVLRRSADDDGLWNLRVIGLSASRVVLGGLVRFIEEGRASFTYRELADAADAVDYGLGVLAVDVDGSWKLAFLPE